MEHTLIKLNGDEWLIMRGAIHIAIERTKTNLDYYKAQCIEETEDMRFNMSMVDDFSNTLKNLEYLKKKTEKFERMDGDEL